MARPSLFPQYHSTILREIAKASEERRRAPSIRDLADVCNVSVSTMHDYLARIVERGELDWRPRSHRAVKLTESGWAAVHAAR